MENSAYIPRLVDSLVQKHLEAFGAVEITGTMWCGKTWTSQQHAKSSIRLDVRANRELAELSPETALSGEHPHLIDEWQEVPTLWDVVRHAVDDAAGQRGLYLLTGSSRPAKKQVHHSGSGRISRLRMWPMTLAETGVSAKSVSLKSLFEGSFATTPTETSLASLADQIVRGGWPDAINVSADAAKLIPNQYVDTLLSAQDNNAPEGERDQRRFLQSLARNLGSSVKIDTLVTDMGYEVEKAVTETGRKRVRDLLLFFTGKFVIDAVSGWDAPIRSPQRLRTKPRYNFADPSLPAALLGVDQNGLMGNTQLFGQLFEQLCLRDLNVYSSVLPAAGPSPLFYYRDADGLEVDAIIELRDGRWGAIETKLSGTKVAQAEESLLRLKKKITANPAARNKEPSFMMVLVGLSDYAYQTKNGIYVVPLTALTA
ncbi:ATP-binding protein [Adlercreutzia sp. ZJ141]|uniref:ATP-binding protein n=1 Tax=Adlercreutzia sp. ZJ141 TaxID=2709406 RepID=UPI0013EAF8D7|nr:DUF4143 domain-containing protein [Adlercreutzia sp. ZJ141]